MNSEVREFKSSFNLRWDSTQIILGRYLSQSLPFSTSRSNPSTSMVRKSIYVLGISASKIVLRGFTSIMLISFTSLLRLFFSMYSFENEFRTDSSSINL